VDFAALLPARSLEDILAKRIRLTIGGEVYTLPVLPISENRKWRERYDRELGRFLLLLSAEDDFDAILGLFDASEVQFLDYLRSYDRLDLFSAEEIERRGLTGLPSVEVIEAGLDPLGLVQATLEVWRAARPLADIARTGLEVALEPPSNAGRPHMPTWLRRITGRTTTSNAN
jgi:hypothetical protein